MQVRRLARILALQALYQMDVAGAEAEPALEAACDELMQPEETQEAAGEKTAKPLTAREQQHALDYARQLVTGVGAMQAELDTKITAYAKNWRVARMAAVDRNVLRIAIFEIFFADKKVPASAAINEAVELAKLYGDTNTPRFINGVLGKMVRDAATQA